MAKAINVILLVIVAAGLCCAGYVGAKIARVDSLYRPYFTERDGRLEWTALGKRWWSKRSHGNALRAAFLMGRPLPTWGYAVQTRLFQGGAFAVFWDPDDDSTLLLYRPYLKAPVPLPEILEKISRQETRDTWGLRLRRWFGKPPSFWRMLRIVSVDARKRPVTLATSRVRLPDYQPPANAIMSSFRVGAETWSALLISPSQSPISRLASVETALATPFRLQALLSIYTDMAKQRPTAAGDARDAMNLDIAQNAWVDALYHHHRIAFEQKQDATVYKMFALDMRAKGLYPQAFYGFQEALMQQPKNPSIWRNLGDTFLAMERYESAEAIFRRLLALRPRSADAQARLAFASEKAGDYTGALKTYREMLRDDPVNVRGCDGIARMDVELGNGKEAEAMAQKLIQLRPTLPDGYEDLCAADTTLKQFDAAMTACTEALNLAPRRATAYGTLAMLYYNQRRLSEALAAFQAADRLAPPTFMNLAYEGMIYANTGHPKEAVAVFEQSVALSPSSAKLHSLLAQAYARAGDTAGVAREKQILETLSSGVSSESRQPGRP